MGVRNSRYWMGQLDWFIDDAGSRENSGADAAHPIPDIERQLRMGPYPLWNGGEYHIRYITDINDVVLRGEVPDASGVFLHGSATNGQGQSTLFPGTITTLVAENKATNIPYQVTASALPTSWTASGLVSATNTTRLRLTSGASGAKFWPGKDLGSKTARCCNTYPALTYTIASIGTPTIGHDPVALVNGNTFVAERLTSIKNFSSKLVFPEKTVFPEIAPTPQLIIESLLLGSRSGSEGHVQFSGSRCSALLDGCRILGIAGSSADVSAIYLCGSSCGPNTAGVIPFLNRGIYFQGLTLGALYNSIHDVNSTIYLLEWMIQGDPSLEGAIELQDKLRLRINKLGVFDAKAAIRVESGADPVSFIGAGSPSQLAFWGSNNDYGVLADNSANISFPIGQGSGFTMATNVADLATHFGAQLQARAWDKSIGLWTQLRTMSWANLLATIAAGGFGNAISDLNSNFFFGDTGASNV